MIPTRTLTPKEFSKCYPPWGNVDKPRGTRSRKDVNTASVDESLSILNNIPMRATSCLIYNNNILRTFRGDDTYPIPEGDQFQQLRELKSLEAVVKEITPNKAVFSYMLVSPEDVLAIFGEDFMEEMKAIQRDVNRTCGS